MLVERGTESEFVFPIAIWINIDAILHFLIVDLLFEYLMEVDALTLDSIVLELLLVL